MRQPPKRGGLLLITCNTLTRLVGTCYQPQFRPKRFKLIEGYSLLLQLTLFKLLRNADIPSDSCLSVLDIGFCKEAKE